jgi:thioredoxin 1
MITLPLIVLLSLFHPFAAPIPQSAAPPSFAPLKQWRRAVLSGDAAALQQLYSSSPEPELTDADNKPVPLSSELGFWSGLKAKGLLDAKLEIAQEQSPQPNVHVVIFYAALTWNDAAPRKQEYLSVAQGWVQQGDRWLITMAQRSNPAGLRQPLQKKEIYPASADAGKEIEEALHSALPVHKRLLLVFGANWCYDCHVLDEAFHSPEIAPTLEKYFEVVHVDIGKEDKNLDLAKKYDVPLNRGVPAIAVLDSNGKLLFSQKHGEFEAARSMATDDILTFLNKWRPASP